MNRPIILFFLILLLALVALGSLSVGAVSIHIADLLSGNLSNMEQTIVLDIRAPRICLAALVGAGVATSGAAIQGLFRNPLALRLP